MTKSVHCPECGKVMADRHGDELTVRRAGLVIRGGVVRATCSRCGRPQEIDLRARTLDSVASTG